MKVTIRFTTDNAAFADCDKGPEVAQILRDLAKVWDYNWAPNEKPSIDLRDSNGNKVGKAKVTA